MKKILLLSAVCLMASLGFAQKNVLKVHPVVAAFKTANIAVERQLGLQSSVQLGFIYADFTYDDYSLYGYGITPEFHYYFPGKEGSSGLPEGVYVAPYARYYKLTVEKEGENAFVGTTGLTGGGVLLGYQLLAGNTNNFALSVYGGPGFLIQGSATLDRGTEKDFNVPGILTGFAPRFGIMAGFAF